MSACFPKLAVKLSCWEVICYSCNRADLQRIHMWVFQLPALTLICQNEFEHKTAVFFVETIDVEGSRIWYDWHFKVTWILCLSGKKNKTRVFSVKKKCWCLKSEFILSIGPAPAIPYSQVRWLWLYAEVFRSLSGCGKGDWHWMWSMSGMLPEDFHWAMGSFALYMHSYAQWENFTATVHQQLLVF